MWPELLNEAGSGRLWISASTAIDARRATETWLEMLLRMRDNSRLIQRSDGFSTLPSALQLAAKFDKKVTDPDSGLTARLDQFIEAGENLSELFLRSIQKFQATDTDAAAYLEKNNLPKDLPTPAG